jgi:hypothetical protein
VLKYLRSISLHTHSTNTRRVKIFGRYMKLFSIYVLHVFVKQQHFKREIQINEQKKVEEEDYQQKKN